MGFYGFRDEIGYDYPMYMAIIYGGYANDVYASKGEILSALLLNIAGALDNHLCFLFFSSINIFNINILFYYKIYRF